MVQPAELWVAIEVLDRLLVVRGIPAKRPSRCETARGCARRASAGLPVCPRRGGGAGAVLPTRSAPAARRCTPATPARTGKLGWFCTSDERSSGGNHGDADHLDEVDPRTQREGLQIRADEKHSQAGEVQKAKRHRPNHPKRGHNWHHSGDIWRSHESRPSTMPLAVSRD